MHQVYKNIGRSSSYIRHAQTDMGYRKPVSIVHALRCGWKDWSLLTRIPKVVQAVTWSITVETPFKVDSASSPPLIKITHRA